MFYTERLIFSLSDNLVVWYFPKISAYKRFTPDLHLDNVKPWVKNAQYCIEEIF